MSSEQYLNALSSERRQTRNLRQALWVVAGVAVAGMWFAWRTPKAIDVHLSPDVAAGTTVRVKDGSSAVPPSNVYSFAYYIWQQVNRWPQDGSKDYGDQIFRMQNYLTPQCAAQLTGDMQVRMKAGELRFRTRALSEIPGFSYASNRVIENGSGTAWTVFLDMQVQETFRGEPVKDVFIRYPIRVVRYDVDRERNPWQLAIDCYGTHRPARLAQGELRAAGASARPSEMRVPTLPGNVAPAALPDAIPLDGAAAGGAVPAATAAEPAAAPSP